MSFFNEVISGVGDVIGAAGDVIAPVVRALPVLGAPVAAGLEAWQAVSQGGQVSVDTPGKGGSYYGPQQNAGSNTVATVLKSSMFGMPIWLMAVAGIGAVVLLRRR